MKTKSIILIAISLGFGLIAALGMTHLMARSKASVAPPIQEIQVLVAKQDIKLGDEVTADMVMMKKFRPGSVPEMSAAMLEEIEGMRAKGNISKGNFLPKELLVEKTQWTTTSIPKGYTVVSTKPDLESTAHNSLSPGDRIDIIAILRNPKTGQHMAKTFLKNIKVFGVNAQTTRQHRDEPIQIKIVQVLVRPRQAEVLALVESVGKLRFVRIGGEETVTETEDDGQFSEDDESSAVSIEALFAGSTKGAAFDAKQRQMLADLQKAQSALEAQKEKLIDKTKPFKMHIHGSNGPIEYVWANRTAMPVAVPPAGNQAMQAPEKPPATAPAPTPDTYPPEGEPETTGGAKSAGSSETSESSEPASGTEETHSY